MPQERSPDRHLELLLPCTGGREVRQFARFKLQFLYDPVHLVENIEEPSIRKGKVFAETVDHHGYPVSVAAITFLDRWCRIARDSAFRQCYKTICKTRETRGHPTRIWFRGS